MYLYLGQNTVVRGDDVVGIFDMDNASTSRHTREFLRAAQQAGQIREVSHELPKSFIICEEKEQITVYLSQIASATLKKRAESPLE